MPAHFSPAALKFLRGLKRHNDREWFEARRELYERELKEPMLAVVAEINASLAEFAPEHVRPPAKVMLRIYRDTRFSPNKLPYKTHLAGWWGRQGMQKTSGAGFYLHLSPDEIRVAAGVFMPEKDQLQAIRRHLLEHHERFRQVQAEAERDGELSLREPKRMARGPKGFPVDHPAADLIQQLQWGVATSLPPDAALQPSLAEEVVRRFRRGAPLVALLNEPLRTTARSLF